MKKILLKSKIAFLKKNPYVLLILCAFIALITSFGVPLKDLADGCGSDDSSEEEVSEMAEKDEIERILTSETENEAQKLAAIKGLISSGATRCSEAQSAVAPGFAPIEVISDSRVASEARVIAGGNEFLFGSAGPFPTVTLQDGRALFTQSPKFNLTIDGKTLNLNWGFPNVRKACPGIVRLYSYANISYNGSVIAYTDIEYSGKITTEFRVASYPARNITRLGYVFNIKKDERLFYVTEMRYDSENKIFTRGDGSTEEEIEKREFDAFPEVLYLKTGNLGMGWMSETFNMWIRGNRPPIFIDSGAENEATLSFTPVADKIEIKRGYSFRDTISFLLDTERCGNGICDQDEDVDSCPADCPQPPACTWDVLNGPVPAGTNTVRGDGSDETQALQTILSAMRPQEVVCFPVSPVSYGVTKLQIAVNDITLYSTGWVGGVKGREARTGGTHVGAIIRRNIAGDVLLHIMADGVTIDGLKLEGPSYNAAYLDYVIHSSNRKRTTIRNCTITDYGRGINLIDNSNYYLISNNRIERMMYAGIYIGSSYGHIFSNYIYDLNEPDVGNSIINSYGIVLSGDSPQNQPNYNLILDNYVGHVIRWAGIIIHAGSYNLIADNVVEDIIPRAYVQGGSLGLAAGIAKTYFPSTPDIMHDHNSIINNKIEHTGLCAHVSGIRAETDDPGEEVLYEDKNSFIGNTCNDAAQSASCTSNGQRNLRLHHNAWLNIGYLRIWHFFKGHIDLHFSNNTSTGSVQGVMVFWDVDANGQQVDVPSWEDITHPRHGVSVINNLPPPQTNPSNLIVDILPSGNRLRWEYPLVITISEDHDSFEIQFRSNESAEWTTIAFRPPNDGRFSFVSENGNVVPFNPLVFIHRDDSRIGKYRVRAWNGDTPSGWSNEVETF